MFSKREGLCAELHFKVNVADGFRFQPDMRAVPVGVYG